MASDRLFEMLAQAKANPSHALRAVEAAGQAGNDILGGYAQGKQIIAQRNEAALKPYEIWSKISDSAGPDVANSIFKQRGIPVPDMSGGGTTPRTPEQLASMGGNWAKTQLGNQNTLDEMKKRNLDIENNQPFPADVAGAIGSGNTDALTKIHAARGEPVPFREMNAAISAKRPAMMGGYFGTKEGSLQLGQLPSQMGPQTAAGAAYQVQVAAHQGKALIASPGAYQRLGMTQGDAARALLRNSPTDEAMRNANFSDTAIGKFNKLKAALTSDPTQIDQPLMRKGLYDALDEMEKSSKPYIANHLANMEANGMNSTFGDKWGSVKQREMGLGVPDVPFDAGGAKKTYQKTAKNAQGVTIGSNDNWATFEPVQGGQ